MRWFVDEEATPMTGYHFPLALAMICTNCNAVFAVQSECPACTSDHLEAIETFLTRARDARQRAEFEAKVADEMKQLTKGLQR